MKFTTIRFLFACTGILMAFQSPWLSLAQSTVTRRVTRTIEETSSAVIRGHLHPRAIRTADEGRVDDDFPLDRITMMFKPTEVQQSQLESYLDELHDPSSADYQ